MAGRHSTPRWRLPLLVVAIGAIAIPFIQFAGNSLIKWVGTVAIAVVVGVLHFLPDLLSAGERAGEERDQEFRKRRFRRWQKNADSQRGG